MNAHSDISQGDNAARSNQNPNSDLERATIITTIGLLRDSGARMTAYLFAGMMARNETEQDISHAGLQRCLAPVKLAIAALLGTGPVEGHDRKALEWMRKELHDDPTCLAGVKALCNYLERFSDNIEAGEPCEIDDIFASLEVVKTKFIGPFNGFIDHLETTIKADRGRRITSLHESATRATNGVERIGEIARTVRMVSINAQIEAARAGDHGKAFTIIAQEINALSDEISRVGTSVKEGLSDTLDFT